jgi:membrane protein implicated in regulation of membrane protease activity
MWRDRTVRFGVIGTVVTALCCFTPLLVLLLTGVGIGWAIGYLDYVLLPALIFFAGLTVYAVWRRQRATTCTEKRSTHNGDI